MNSNEEIKEFLHYIMCFLSSFPKSEVDIFEKKFEENLKSFTLLQNKRLILMSGKPSEKIKTPIDFDFFTLKLELNEKICDMITALNGLNEGVRRTDFELKILLKVIIHLLELISQNYTEIREHSTLDYYLLSREIIKDGKADLVNFLKWKENWLEKELEKLELSYFIEDKETLIHKLVKELTKTPQTKGDILVLSRAVYNQEKTNFHRKLHEAVKSIKGKSQVSKVQKSFDELWKQLTNSSFQRIEFSEGIEELKQSKKYKKILSEIKDLQGNSEKFSKEKFMKILKFCLDFQSKSNHYGNSPKVVLDKCFEVLDYIFEIEASEDENAQFHIKEKFHDDPIISPIIKFFQTSKNKEKVKQTLSEYRDHSKIHFHEDSKQISFNAKFGISEYKKNPLESYYTKKDYSKRISPLEQIANKYNSSDSSLRQTVDLSSGVPANLNSLLSLYRFSPLPPGIRFGYEDFETLYGSFRNTAFFDFEFSQLLLNVVNENGDFKPIIKAYKEKIHSIRHLEMVIIPFEVLNFKSFLFIYDFKSGIGTFFSFYNCKESDFKSLTSILENLFDKKLKAQFQLIISQNKDYLCRNPQYFLHFLTLYVANIEEGSLTINETTISRFYAFISGQLYFINNNNSPEFQENARQLIISMNEHPQFFISYSKLNDGKVSISGQIENLLANAGEIRKKRYKLLAFGYSSAVYAFIEGENCTAVSFDNRKDFDISILRTSKSLQKYSNINILKSQCFHYFAEFSHELVLSLWAKLILTMSISPLEAFKIIYRNPIVCQIFLSFN